MGIEPTTSGLELPSLTVFLPDSIGHTFLDCTVTTAFYSKAMSWFNHENDTDITLSSKQITLNDIPRLTRLTDYRRRRLHLFVIALKQYIYACKCLHKNTNMQEFQRKVELQWLMEKCALSLNQIFSRSLHSDLTSQLIQTKSKAQSLIVLYQKNYLVLLIESN